METTAETIIKKIEGSYAKILHQYQGVPVSQLLEPALSNGWSVKDILAHLAAWEWRCASLLTEIHDTNTPLKAMPNVEALNREIYQERQEWSWEEVEDEFREGHKALLEAIRELPPERLNEAIVQESIAEETWEHYEEHLPDLQCWRERINRRGE